MIHTYILVCGGTGCHSNHSQDVMAAFDKLIKDAGMEDEVQVVQTGCQGLCAKGPIVVVHPGGVFYEEITPEKAERIFAEHIIKGRVVEKYTLKEEAPVGTEKDSIDGTNFYKRQTRVALRNCGVIDPENIDEYIGRGGYEALGRALTEMTPEEVCKIIIDSGLRGRGGGGFPTGRKWQFAMPRRGEVQKYVMLQR